MIQEKNYQMCQIRTDIYELKTRADSRVIFLLFIYIRSFKWGKPKITFFIIKKTS